MTHCLSSSITPDASDATCLSVANIIPLLHLCVCVCVCSNFILTRNDLLLAPGFISGLSSIFVMQFKKSKIVESSPNTDSFSCRFVCCVMVAVPLAATLFTAIIRRQQNREVSPTAESSCLNSGLNVYGTLKTNSSSCSRIDCNTSEENSNSKNNMCYVTWCIL